jgi:ribosomal protein S11
MTEFMRILWYVLGIAWIAVAVGIFVVYNRKQRERGAARAAQMAALLAEVKGHSKTAPVAAAVTVAVGATGPEFSRKQRLLPQPAALLYYVFRAALPDHEIFAGLALRDVVEVAGTTSAAQREQLLHKLAQHPLDLVVCNKRFEVVAVVVGNSARAQGDGAQFALECLQAAGLRVVSIDPARPPRRQEVHALIYG